MDKLENLINPNNVAVVGASNDLNKVGGIIMNNLISSGYKGEIFPVNVKHNSIQNKKAYVSLSSIGKQIDLVCIAVPAQFVLDIAKEAASINVKSIIVISAGFSEIGKNGADAEDELVKICRDNNISLLGPNCLGLINTFENLNCSFSSDTPKKGGISVISQSGAIISALVDWSLSSEIGFNKIFSVGNKADIDECDLLEYLYKDTTTSVIVLYLEELEITKKLSEILIAHSKEKPTVVLFGGRSAYGQSAASSHTGSMISSFDAIKTYLRQSGVILANSVSRLFNLCVIFSSYRNIDGRNIAIVTNAGGPAIIACDSLSYYNMKLAKLDESTTEKLKNSLRPQANIKNPVDILGDGDEKEYENAINILEKDENVDAIVALLTIQSNTPIENILENIENYKGKKPLACAFIGGERTHNYARKLTAKGFPCYVFPEDAIASLSALNFFNHNKIELKPPTYCGVRYDDSNIYSLASKYGLPFEKYFHTGSFSHAKEIVSRIGYPVVAKTADPNIIHKTEKNGVIVNIGTDTELQKALSKIGFPATIGKMIKGSLELFIGAKKYENMGTVILFGTGGIWAEIYNDITMRFAPISKTVAIEMIKETKVGKILAGARGQSPYNIDKLADIIVNVSKFVDDHCNIKEVDFNPIIATHHGYHIVDTRIICD